MTSRHNSDQERSATALCKQLQRLLHSTYTSIPTSQQPIRLHSYYIPSPCDTRPHWHAVPQAHLPNTTHQTLPLTNHSPLPVPSVSASAEHHPLHSTDTAHVTELHAQSTAPLRSTTRSVAPKPHISKRCYNTACLPLPVLFTHSCTPVVMQLGPAAAAAAAPEPPAPPSM